MPNPRAALISYLMSDSGVTALASTRIFGELPGSENQYMPRACLVLTETGSGSLGPGARSYVPWGVTRMDIRAYGSTPYEASQLYHAMNVAVKQMARTVAASTVLQDAIVSAGPRSGRDPDVDWPFVWGSYEVSALEE